MSILTRMLLIDHSIVFREMLRKRFLEDPHINILPAASDPFDALHKVNKYRPDVIICANELPYLTGNELIEKHLGKYNIPIIAMSVKEESKDAALQAGAKHFVVKPSDATHDQGLAFMNMLLSLVMQLRQQDLLEQSQQPIRQSYYYQRYRSHRSKVIAIGASTQKEDAIVEVLSSLPSNSPPVLLMHDTSYGESNSLIERLKAACTMSVKEADVGECLQTGTIMVAASDRSLRLQSDQHYYYVTEAKGHERLPMDSFFDSVAATMGSDAIGILLADSQDDGVSGLQNLGRTGARVFIRKDKDMRADQEERINVENESALVAAIHSSDALTKQLLYSI